jgi:manganese/zinc/iron transport system permease protein
VNIINFFIDPVLRAPTIGSMLMCLVAAIVGVLVFVRKRSLVGESLSHATYPGVTCAILLAGVFQIQETLPFLILAGAFFSALVGFFVIDFLEKKMRVAPDAALTAVLAFFFGIGVTVASCAQSLYAHLYRQAQAFLYGQAATLTDTHVVIYGVLSLLVIFFISLFYKQILALAFDIQFARTTGLAGKCMEAAIFFIVVLTLVIGIRCVGVVLMASMLIAPAAAARQFTNKLYLMFVWAGIFGSLSGFFGIYLSTIFSQKIEIYYAIPSGPMIVLVSGCFALYALLFAPRRGLMIRYGRIMRFRMTCIEENLLKVFWRMRQEGHCPATLHAVSKNVSFSSFYLRVFLFKMRRQHALTKQEGKYDLTQFGTKRGARIVRLHRLWEVYLVNSLGLNLERVHKSAEEMEHILTPDLEKKLTELLSDPKQDPHDQPIPGQNEVESLRVS